MSRHVNTDGRLNLEQQRKRAKELLPRLKTQDPNATLSLAQWEIARQLAGFKGQFRMLTDPLCMVWPQRDLRLTPLAHQVLTGDAYWLDHASHERWVAGVCLRPGQPHWTIDEDANLFWRD